MYQGPVCHKCNWEESQCICERLANIFEAPSLMHPKPPPTDFCQSGGAEGSDTRFAYHAIQKGHGVVIWSFQGHRPLRPTSSRVKIERVDPDNMEIRNALADVISKLRRNPIAFHRNYVWNLLRRDMAITANAESVYAIGNWDKDSKTHWQRGSVGIDGGTAYACQRFVNDAQPGILPFYFFQQTIQKWFRCNKRSTGEIYWTEYEDASTIPKPMGIYAGIGTRALNAAGRDAIASLYAE